MRKTLTKKQKLELELMAIKLWFQAFGKPSMSSDNDKVYMSGKLNEYTDKINKLVTDPLSYNPSVPPDIMTYDESQYGGLKYEKIRYSNSVPRKRF
jgi:hypothetical protein